jgi:hypothetical protein
MPNVFDFLNVQLNAFSDDGGIYDNELKLHCKKLNKYLNDVTISDYEAHIKSSEMTYKKKSMIYQMHFISIYTLIYRDYIIYYMVYNVIN